jgi:hypothetical protein
VAFGVVMKKLFVVARNLLDTSQIKESFSSTNEYEYVSCSKLSQFVEKLEGHQGQVFAIIDYSLFDHPDDLIELHSILDEDVHVTMYGPHEMMNTLRELYPTMNFVARSVFFRDPRSAIS